jgi:hypothetical protein
LTAVLHGQLDRALTGDAEARRLLSVTAGPATIAGMCRLPSRGRGSFPAEGACLQLPVWRQEVAGGWTRSYVLWAWGYCKDAGPFTAAGGTIEPLPFAGMSNYPYGSGEHYPNTPRHQDYLRRYQTRWIGGVR